MFAAVNTGETQGISSKARQKFLSGKFAWKSSAKEKTNRELEKDAEEREKNRVDQSPPENWVRESRLVLSEAVEWHFSADEGFNRGFPEAQRQTVDNRVKQQDQAENDERQNEQVGRSRKKDLPYPRLRWIRGTHPLASLSDSAPARITSRRSGAQ